MSCLCGGQNAQIPKCQKYKNAKNYAIMRCLDEPTCDKGKGENKGKMHLCCYWLPNASGPDYSRFSPLTMETSRQPL